MGRRGLVSPEQAEAIRHRYADPGEGRSSATTALAVIGAVAVGFGVIGFVAANWDGMSHGVRLALLTAAVAGSYAAAYHLRERTGNRPRVGEALYLLGVLLFGASLFLVGQMYNVQAHDPLALLLWSGGATATALVVRSRAIAATAVLIFTAWIGFEFGLALDDAGGDAFAAFPVVAVFYGGALYGLATAAQRRIREHWFASSGFPSPAVASASGRGRRAVRLHVLRGGRRARPGHGRARRHRPRGVRAPGGAAFARPAPGSSRTDQRPRRRQQRSLPCFVTSARHARGRRRRRYALSSTFSSPRSRSD